MTGPRKKKVDPGAVGFGIIRNEDLAVFGTREMALYADEVNLDRAIPDLIDGLKTVQRRILWASSQLGKDFVKTARVAGDCMGQYHPHSDKAITDAITVLVQSNQPPMLGKGNWGSLLDPAAAPRYTNCCLSAYGRTFFDPDYMNKEVTSFVPNFDDTKVEPVTLPALMPNILMTGAEGIGVGKGATTVLPSFSAASLAEVMIRLLKGEQLKPEDFAKSLKHYNRYGGQVVNSKQNRAAWLQMFTGSQARVLFQSRLEIDREGKAVEIDDWPLGLDPSKLTLKLKALPEVDQAYNSKGATRIRVEMRRDHNYAQFDKLVEKIQKLTTVARSFKCNVTHRTVKIEDGVVSFDTKYLSLSVPQLLMTWLRERVALEKRSLTYRIRKVNEAIAYSELLIFVAQNADRIIKVIRASNEPERDLVRKFKLSDLQAKQVCDLQLRAISKLDQTKVGVKLKEQRAELRQLENWLKKPRAKIVDDTQRVLDAIAQDAKFEASKSREMKVS